MLPIDVDGVVDLGIMYPWKRPTSRFLYPMARPKKLQSELRVDLRMRVPPKLKTDIEQAASSSGKSITAWMEEAAMRKLEEEFDLVPSMKKAP